MRADKAWRRLSADEYAALFPAKPRAIRKIAAALRRLGAENAPFTMAEWELARLAGVSVRTLQRYMPIFENYGILEVKRWRYRTYGPVPNTYRLFLGTVIPEDWTRGDGNFPISPRQVA